MINYYTAIQEGDIEKANSYCTEEYLDALELSDINEMIDEQLSALNLGADFSNEAKNFMKNLLSQIIKKYVIEDIKVNGNEATAKVVLLSIDLENLYFDDVSSELETLAENYVLEHETEIQEKIRSVTTQEEFYNWLYAELSSLLFDYMNDYVNNFATQEYFIEIPLNKEHDTWKMNKTSIQ